MDLSLVASFDDLRRCDDVLTDGTAEIEFRSFLELHNQMRHQWSVTTQEAQRMQRELDNALKTMADLETKLFHARRLLEMESKARRTAESERDAIDKKMSQVCDFLRNDNDIKDETRNKIAMLNASNRRRRSKPSKFIEEKYGNEINSTGSFLSDLSVTQSEDDFLDVNLGTSGRWKKHRPSCEADVSVRKARRSGRKSLSKSQGGVTSHLDVGAGDKVVATTRVSIPQNDGPIEATSVIEAIPQANVETTSLSSNDNGNNHQHLNNDAMGTPSAKTHKLSSNKMFTPSAPPLHEINNQTPKYLINLQGKQHSFTNKTIIRSDTCTYCLKKIRFGSVALKCRNCRVSVHPDCKLFLNVACVSSTRNTPNLKGEMGVIADYAPNDGPMVPGLIVHCVNEIETRGLSEEGVYRVSGSEKDVKALKERFLRGRTIPPLANYDIHVICGCIKDFLRSLREPIIPTSLWKDFSNAVQNVDDKQAVQDLRAAIERLPQANRDTLAFLIQHLQRVANCPSTKMPISNLSKIFGPTVLGYSSAEPDNHAMFTETMIQANVMTHLLTISTDYWSCFLNIDTDSQKSDGGDGQSGMHTTATLGRSYFGTPTLRNGNSAPLRKERKFFATPPYTTKRK